jgi:type I restriction enzyme S subunit
MNDFDEYKLDELYSISSGISSKPEQAGHGTPFLSFKTIFNNFYLPEELEDLMKVNEKEAQTYSIKKGDVFLTRTSETIDELAMSSVALSDYPNATFTGFAKRLRPLVDNVIYDRFMAFYFRSQYFRKIIDNNAVMTLRASFNENIFSYIKIKIPKYKKQVLIGDFLYKIEEKRKLNEKIYYELEKYISMLFEYWFVQFDFPNTEGKPYKSTGGDMIWTGKYP